ncbi:MAG TPA: glycoside hydrolase family 9 protein [Polyangiaceae bacterium]|nr:glycoside hydrolase family 9 protein [Polyangiaceae bacterium]
MKTAPNHSSKLPQSTLHQPTTRARARRTIRATCCVAVTACFACAPKQAVVEAPPASGAAVSTVGAPKSGELLQRSSFEDGATLPWMPLVLPPASGEAVTKDGAYCMRVERAGKNSWDLQIRHREMTIVKGHHYTARFKAWASAPVKLRAQIGMSGPPYAQYWGKSLELGTEPTVLSESFSSSAADDPTAEFAFHIGDASTQAPVTVCIDDIHLTDPEFVAVAKPKMPEPPGIRLNQLGYAPQSAKRATWVVGSQEGAGAQKRVPFELVDAAGKVVHRGVTEPFGKDPTSGLFVQRIDFSSYSAPGEKLRIRLTNGDSRIESDPFSITASPLKQLSRDALRYFYYTRSGIALEQPFVEDARWVRVVGHPTDSQVPCAPDAKCTYSLDVSGGWYDAGDYGKYVVNGGLSAWLLTNLYEAAQQLKLTQVVGTKDNDLHLPESGNGTPDVLDEVRWELEWMLKMQVPAGDAQAGLVHHKIHDVDWSSLGTLPLLQSATPRQLRPVSTAATLNLAAAAAQAARVFSTLDPKFAARCLAAAKRAWVAAEANPKLLITGADNHGGGAYEDDDVSDERFWAATELFITTGEKAYFTASSESPHFSKVPAPRAGAPQSLDWRSTSALGTLSLALDERHTPAKVRDASRKAVIEAADKYLSLVKADAFGQPYAGAHYPWGSNSFIVNNGLILAYAHAFTHDARYLEGAQAALDYVLGRNALGKSYVTGYGARPLVNPHHRLWAHSIDAKFPPPPPGVLSGGPNSDLQDPYSKGLHPHCVGQTCFVDHIEAYSANEVAINWNAAFAWLTGYLNVTTK